MLAAGPSRKVSIRIPNKLISLRKALHKSVKVKFGVDGVEQVIESIIEVKQGNILGPNLFIFLNGCGYEFLALLPFLQIMRSPMQSIISAHWMSADDERRFGIWGLKQ